ncbi:uncharacterized protein [Anoplolepis gracilipes]|uniref:uncharacterized protein n=1 Tax=Anoplolepis gracilipes TaxID=354296 RepID=UPI003B9F71CA
MNSCLRASILSSAKGYGTEITTGFTERRFPEERKDRGKKKLTLTRSRKASTHIHQESNSDEVGQSNTSAEREMLVNINCSIKMILNYIRKVARMNSTCEFDLCDEINCQLKNISLYEPYTNGTDILQSDSTYFIITFERDENGQMINFTPLLIGKVAKRCCDILAKVRRPLRKTSSIKSTPKRNNN